MTTAVLPRCPWCTRGFIHTTGVLCRTCGGTGLQAAQWDEPISEIDRADAADIGLDCRPLPKEDL